MRHIRFALALLCVAAAAVALAPSASASETQTSTTLPAGTGIGDGLYFTSAVISTPGDPAPRTLDAYHAAVFVQSWMGEAFFGKPQFQDPPAGLPVYQVDVTGTWGEVAGTGVQTVYYASDGTTAWLSYPQGQVVTATQASPPPPEKWFIAPARTIEAFNGTATLIDTAGVVQATTPRTAPPAASDSGGSGSGLKYGLIIALVVLVLGGGMMLYRRRRSSDSVAAA